MRRARGRGQRQQGQGREGEGKGKIKEWLTFDDMENDDDTMMRGGLKVISFLAWNVLSVRQQQLMDSSDCL